MNCRRNFSFLELLQNCQAQNWRCRHLPRVWSLWGSGNWVKISSFCPKNIRETFKIRNFNGKIKFRNIWSTHYIEAQVNRHQVLGRLLLFFSSNYLGTRFKVYEGPASRSRLQISSILYVNFFIILQTFIFYLFRARMF